MRRGPALLWPCGQARWQVIEGLTRSRIFIHITDARMDIFRCVDDADVSRNAFVESSWQKAKRG